MRLLRSYGLVRKQLLWIALGALAFIAVTACANILQLAGAKSVNVGDIYVAAFLAIPVAACIAILRHRLFDIEVVIGRAAVLTTVFGFITAVYLAAVTGLGVLVGRGTGASVLLAVVVTAVAAVGAQPLRARLKDLARRLVLPPLPAEKTSGIAIQTLGTFRLVRDGQPVPGVAWQSKKARTLVKILVARRGRSITRDQLAEILWPGEEAGVVSRRLSVALATARTVLDPDRTHAPDHALAAEDSALRLNLSHVDVDVERFIDLVSTALIAHREGDARGSLIEAERMYAGDFLEEDRYEDWSQNLRDEARLAYRSVAMAIAAIEIRRGDAGAAIRRYLRLLEQDEYDEPAHLGLVRALDAAGRHGDARRRYNQYAARMAELEAPVAPYPRAIGVLEAPPNRTLTSPEQR